jgi:hypothetical protein
VGQAPIAKVRRVVTSLVIALLFVVLGCCKSFDQSTKQENEKAAAWVTGSWSGQYDWAGITSWRSVTESKRPQTETLLQSTASLRITAEQALDLTGESGPHEGKTTPYLLRAVGDGAGVFPMEPSTRPNGDVWIGGGANSKCPVPMRRRPVVAWLDRMPDKVYVTFYVNYD